MSLWDEVKKNVVDLYTVTSDKTTEITKVSSRRWDKFAISRDIERQFGELGNLVYTGLKEGREEVLQDPQVGVLMARIEALESELRQKESEIENIQEEHRARREGPPPCLGRGGQHRIRNGGATGRWARSGPGRGRHGR